MPRIRMRIPILSAAVPLALSLGCLLFVATVARAQNNFDLAIHANSDVSPADIGLPAYPGAPPYGATEYGPDGTPLYPGVPPLPGPPPDQPAP